MLLHLAVYYDYPRKKGTSFSLTSSAMMAVAITDMTTRVARPPWLGLGLGLGLGDEGGAAALVRVGVRVRVGVGVRGRG